MSNLYRQMHSKQSTPRKLDRRNASRDIDYEATSLSASTSFDASAPHRSSFRIKGVDGEFDLICRSLGLSGPEDFAIPASAWEARRSRSSFDRVSDVNLHNEIDNVCADSVGSCIYDRDFEKIRVTDSNQLNSDENSENFKAVSLSSTHECFDQLNSNQIPGRFGASDLNKDNNVSSNCEMKIGVAENERSENGFTPDKFNFKVEGTNKLHDRYEVASKLGNHYNLVELRVSDSDRDNYLSSNDEAKNRVNENNNSDDGTSNGLNPAILEAGVGRNSELENFDEGSSKLGDHQNLVELRITNSDSDNLSETFKPELEIDEKKRNEKVISHVNNRFSLAKIEVRDMGDNEIGKFDENPRELGCQTATSRKGISVRTCRSGGGKIMGAHLLGSFVPQNDEDKGSAQKEMTVEDIEEVERPIVVRENVDGAWLGDIIVVSESCSRTSENKDDDSNVALEPLLLVSPFRFKFKINSWQKGDFLGSGSFGTVFEGYTEDGIFFAVKEVSLLDQGDQAKQSIFQLEQEIFFLSQFQHENIVQYLGTEKDKDKLYIFLELVTKGSLASLYQKYNLQDSQVSAYTRQILSGLNYLHLRRVVHRDIKCANILVDASGSVKLADFGLAKATNLNDLKSCKGTAFWMAPEVVNRKNQGYGLAADIWSLGCTVLEMLTRRIPYSHLEGMQALFRIGKGEPPPIPRSLSSEARDFVSKCLQVKPDDRPTAAQLLDHPFVKRSLPTFSAPASPFHNGRRS